jgi:hypothetical protein
VAKPDQTSLFDMWSDRNARRQTINSLPAILLPHGHQVEEKERKEKLALVETELKRFVAKGFGYKGSDLRWRHVVSD